MPLGNPTVTPISFSITDFKAPEITPRAGGVRQTSVMIQIKLSDLHLPGVQPAAPAPLFYNPCFNMTGRDTKIYISMLGSPLRRQAVDQGLHGKSWNGKTAFSRWC